MNAIKHYQNRSSMKSYTALGYSCVIHEEFAITDTV